MEAVKEARRYVENARELLKDKARKREGYYQDQKYVKMAGNTAYNGILVALDSLLDDKVKGRKDVKWYKSRLARLDKKVLSSYTAAYDTLHLALGYDGNPLASVASAGLKEAEKIIDWVERRSVVA